MKKNGRVIPVKNYFIIAFIFVLTIGLVFFFRNWYNSYKTYEDSLPVLSGILSEVRYNEIDNYINDNRDVVIYISSSDDSNSRVVDKKLKKLIEKEHLKDRIVYYNITDVIDKEKLIDDFNNNYSVNENIYSYPAIVILEDGKILDFRCKTKGDDLTIKDVKSFLEKYQVFGD